MWRIATSSLEVLGYDPSIRRVYSRTDKISPDLGYDARDQYDIDVLDATGNIRSFRTYKMLSDFAAESALGRGTRVWEVQELKNGELDGPHCTLKDTWSQVRRTREGEVYSAIHEALGPDEKPHFLTVLTYGQSRAPTTRGRTANKSVSWDATRLRGPIRRHSRLSTPIVGSLEPSRTPVGSHLATYEVLADPGFWPRRRERIVFREVGVPLANLTSDEKAWVAMKGALTGESFIRYMFCLMFDSSWLLFCLTL